MFRNSKMSLRFLRILVMAAVCSTALFFLLHYTGNALLMHINENSDLQEKRTEARVCSFQSYVNKRNLSVADAPAINAWCRNQPLVLMEIYQNGKLVFNSSYSDTEALSDRGIDASFYDWYSYYSVSFCDGDAELFLIVNDIYEYQNWMTIGEILFSAIVFVLIFLRGVRKVVSYICVLSEEIQILEGGDLNHPITVRGKDELGHLAQGLDAMRLAFRAQRDAEVASVLDNQSIITGMSHDLRTPLTKLMICTEILRSGKYESENQMKDYLNRIDENALQIKQLSDNIFRYSTQPNADTAVTPMLCSLKQALYGPLAEMTEYLSRLGYFIAADLFWPDVCIFSHELYLKRTLDNLSSNIEKYADISHPVRIRNFMDQEFVCFSFWNCIDRHAKPGGDTNIGLLNVKAMMQELGGECLVTQNKQGFLIELRFLCGNCVHPAHPLRQEE